MSGPAAGSRPSPDRTLAAPCRPRPYSSPLPPHSGAFNDWNKDRQFQKLNAQKDVIEVKVVRGCGPGGGGTSQTLTVPNTELVVGDVVVLDTGDKIVADGYIIEVWWCGGGVVWGAILGQELASLLAATPRQRPDGGPHLLPPAAPLRRPAYLGCRCLIACHHTHHPPPPPLLPPPPTHTHIFAQVHGLIVDEASLTGESDPVKKGPEPSGEPWLRSGTQVGLAHWLAGVRARLACMPPLASSP